MGMKKVDTSEWEVLVKNASAIKLSVSFRHISNDWNYIKAGFWASNRADFIAGSTAASK